MKFPRFEEVVSFHGHRCPGLAVGYQVAIFAMKQLNVPRSDGDDLVVIVENDSCAVDAVQYITGCTFGKGNLIFRDYGKFGFTFYNRENGDSFRIYADLSTGKRGKQSIKELKVEDILAFKPDDFLVLKDPEELLPARARIQESKKCFKCGELTMAAKMYDTTDGMACFPCSEEYDDF